MRADLTMPTLTTELPASRADASKLYRRDGYARAKQQACRAPLYSDTRFSDSSGSRKYPLLTLFRYRRKEIGVSVVQSACQHATYPCREFGVVLRLFRLPTPWVSI